MNSGHRNSNAIKSVSSKHTLLAAARFAFIRS
jgi:hypothetical protein